jgi:hypothetical protein
MKPIMMKFYNKVEFNKEISLTKKAIVMYDRYVGRP